MKCYWPWQGMTICPQGYINLCCNTRKSTPFSVNIKDVESLWDVWYGEEYMRVRSQMEEIGWERMPSCATCKKGINKAPLHHSQSLFHKGLINGLYYLELSTSNVCNQMCVMCNSEFSTKWQDHEEKFDRLAQPTFSYSDEDIDKIIEVMTDVRYIQFKGGEPFADLKNLRIIKAARQDCNIYFTSNMQHVPKAFEDEIVGRDVGISASIDGIGRLFNWIRGGDFDRVIDNMERLYSKGLKPFQVNVCVSAYNVRHLREIVDYFKDKPFVRPIEFNNNSIVVGPWWCSVTKLFDQDEYDQIINDQFEGTDVDITSLKNLKCQKIEYQTHAFAKYTSIMNEVRGFERYK